MPANFDSNITTPLNNLRTISRGATSFASDMVSLLTAAFGDNNPFGTASTRDTGTAADNVPLLNSDGEIDSSILPTATTTNRGAVRLANDIFDTGDGVVATTDQLRQLTATGTRLSATDFDVAQITSGASYTAPAIGLLFVAASGGGGSTPGITSWSSGNNGLAASATISLGTTYPASSGNTLTAPGGNGGGSPHLGPQGFDFLSVRRGLANHPDFAIRLYGKGAPGGDPGSFDPDTNVSNNEVAGLPGNAGDLIIAKFRSGANFRVDIGAAGTGAPGHSATSTTSSVAARAGKNGYAFFVRLA